MTVLGAKFDPQHRANLSQGKRLLAARREALGQCMVCGRDGRVEGERLCPRCFDRLKGGGREEQYKQKKTGLCYTMTELSQLVNRTSTTILYHIQKGRLKPSGKSGENHEYFFSDEEVDRFARLIRAMEWRQHPKKFLCRRGHVLKGKNVLRTKNKRCRGGYDRRCRECNNARMRAKYAAMRALKGRAV